MGLTVHYELQLSLNRDDATREMFLLHQRVEQLPVQSVSPLGVCNKPKIIDGFSAGDEEVLYSGQYGDTQYVRVHPDWACGFHANIGPGCESLSFQLYGYPATVRAPSHSLRKSYRVLKVNRPNLTGYGFCKTEYAGSPQHGGPENFLKCHLTVIRALEIAKSFGLLIRVKDESGYWDSMELRDLLQASGMKRFTELPTGWGKRLSDLGLLPIGMGARLVVEDQHEAAKILEQNRPSSQRRVLLRQPKET